MPTDDKHQAKNVSLSSNDTAAANALDSPMCDML
jgi:hypothetical protein